MFIPKGVNYLFNNFNTLENYFLINHTFNFFNVNKHNKKSLKQKIKQSKFDYYTLSFGFKDFISSTAFGTIFNSGQLDVSYGLDIIFVIRFLKNRHIKQPQYFLSSFQMPF
jgi:hypothetical protein